MEKMAGDLLLDQSWFKCYFFQHNSHIFFKTVGRIKVYYLSIPTSQPWLWPDTHTLTTTRKWLLEAYKVRNQESPCVMFKVNLGRIQDSVKGGSRGVRRFPERYFWAKVNIQIGIFHTNEWAKGGFDWTPEPPWIRHSQFLVILTS